MDYLTFFFAYTLGYTICFIFQKQRQDRLEKRYLEMLRRQRKELKG